MEKTKSLVQIDRSICNYFEAYNNTKKNEISGYPTSKEQISEFYRSMGDSIFHKKIKQNLDSNRKQSKTSKKQTQIHSNIENSIKANLPKQIFQHNTIKVDGDQEHKIIKAAMFSEVPTSKKSKYSITKEVIEMITEDIKTMSLDKQQAKFRKKFPNLDKQSKNVQIDNSKTEKLIKQYNRILTKYKNKSCDSYHITLGLLQQSILQDAANDVSINGQKFQIIKLFKKIYLQTKSQNINENLLRYIRKFQHFDKLEKKMRTVSVLIKKTNESRPFSASTLHLKDRSQSKIYPRTFPNVQGQKQQSNFKSNQNKRLSHFCKFKEKDTQIKKSKLKIVMKSQSVKNH